MDLDFYVPISRLDEVADVTADYVTRLPSHHRDEDWDLTFMKLEYEGRPIELGGADGAQYFDRQAGLWREAGVRFDASVETTIFGVRVPVMPLDQLVEYKERLDRDVDRQDVAEIVADQRNRVTSRTYVGIAAALVAVCGLIAAAVFPGARLIALPMAVLGGLVAGTVFSVAGKFSTQLADLKGQSVSVQIWGAAPEGADTDTFRVDSLRALGAGLHLWLERAPGDGLTHLKIAQPEGVSWAAGEVRISGAAYVQWAGRRLSRREGQAALELRVREPLTVQTLEGD